MAEPLSGSDGGGGTHWELPGASPPPRRPVRSRRGRSDAALPPPSVPLWGRLVPHQGWAGRRFAKLKRGTNKLLGTPSALQLLGAAPHPALPRRPLTRHPLTRHPLLLAPGRYPHGRVPAPAGQLKPGDDERRCSQEPTGAKTLRLRPVCRAVPHPRAAPAGGGCSLPGTRSCRGPSPRPDHADGKLQPGR